MGALLALVPEDPTGHALAFVLVFGRIGTFMFTMPGLGEQQIPPRVRIGMALAVSAAIAPMTSPVDPAAPWIGLLVSEIAVGAVFGLLLRSSLWVLQTTGAMLAQGTAILPPNTGALTPEPLPALGTLFLLSGLVLLFASDLYLIFLKAALDSLALAPPGVLLDVLLEPNALIAHGRALFWSAASLAFPFLSVSCAYYITIGVINRALPQLMVTFIGAPVLTGLAFVVLWLQAPEIMILWREHVFGVIAELARLG